METLLTVLAGLTVWSVVVEPQWLHLRRVKVCLEPALKQALTVLHISDTHFPLHLAVLNRFFNRLSGLRPDLVVYTGDIIDSDDGIEPCARAVSKLKSRHGIYAVLGNHDHFNYDSREILAALAGRSFMARRRNDVARLRECLAGAGCRVLMNESVTLEIRGERISLVGVDDPVTRHADVEAAFRNVDGAPVRILLTHSVDILRKMEGREIHFAVGGHTHGGQFSIPLIGPPPLWAHSRLGRRYVAGLSRYGNTVTYTSRGMGEGRLFPFRFLCRPEAILYDLQ